MTIFRKLKIPPSFSPILEYNSSMNKKIDLTKITRKHINITLIAANLLAVASLAFVLAQRNHNSQALEADHQQIQTSDDTETANSSSAPKEEEDKTKLLKGSNHNIAASDYAYDVTAVRNTIKGYSQEVQGKIVFLTFDDGIDPTLTPAVMDTLKAYGVPATFFHIGYTLTEDNADILKRQIKEGHAIANHTLSHNFDLLYPGRVPNPDQIIAEVNQTNANFQAILGSDFNTRVFRYPGGHMSWNGLESTDASLSNLGVEWIDWNMLTGDAEAAWKRPTDSASMMAFLENSQQYFPETEVKVVLMHDTAGKELTLQTLPQIIEYYQNQGYTFGVLE